MRDERLVHLAPTWVRVVRAGDDERALEVHETQEEGHALIQVVIPDGVRALAFAIPHKRPWPFLANQVVADGHILVEASAGWTAHIIECKRTLKRDKWDQARGQIAASMVRLQFLADFLGISIVAWRAWVAYRESRMREREPADPALLKAAVGGASLPVGTWDSRALHGAFGDTIRVGEITLDEAGERKASISAEHPTRPDARLTPYRFTPRGRTGAPPAAWR